MRNLVGQSLSLRAAARIRRSNERVDLQECARGCVTTRPERCGMQRTVSLVSLIEDTRMKP